ncbi:MAG: HdaA/DnaA family protein, partial [Alphaproteobacteria bacterium]
MTPPSQLVLEFEHRPSLDGEDFLVAPCNAEAVAWLDRWPDWPAPVLVVCGPPGCGKSHLAEVFLAGSGGVRLSRRQLEGDMPPDPWSETPACVIEDMDKLLAGNANERLEENLFHLYNTAREGARHLLLTAATPPSRWNFGLADLASRLKSSGVVEIGTPDDALIAAVLVKQFADRQL